MAASPILATFLFELVNLLALALLLGWLLFKPVRTMLAERQAAARARADELSARAADLDARGEALQKERVAFEKETAGMRTERLAAADRDAAAILSDAREAAARTAAQAGRTIAHIERAQLERLADAAARAGRESVAHLLRWLDLPDLDVALVRSACRQLAGLTRDRLGVVLVESARALSDEPRMAVENACHGRATTVEYRVVPDLGSGLRITTTAGLIDTSARRLAMEAEETLATALKDETTAVTP